MNNSWHIRGGTVADPLNGTETVEDLFISNGRVEKTPQTIPPEAKILDATGLFIVPGLIDLHVHLREPGYEDAETIESGCRAAARGGFSTVVAMPNTTPPADSPEIISYIRNKADRKRLAQVLPAGCITRRRAGDELADIRALAAAGAIAFTDDGSTVADDRIMAAAMRTCRALGKCIMDHALDPALAANGVMHQCDKARLIGLPGIPSAAETKMVERDIHLAETTGCTVHIQHVSAAESVRLIREARSRGISISGEATPHHLTLTDVDVIAEDADFKMNPPLRAESDRQAILAAVADGTLQALATDHAPHTRRDKARGFLTAPFGIVGLETAIGVTFTALVTSGAMSRLEWLRRWTTGPASIIGISPPALRPGLPANLAILDLESIWTVQRSDFVSKSVNTPFEGHRLCGRAVCTFLDGKPTWADAKNYDIVDTEIKICE